MHTVHHNDNLVAIRHGVMLILSNDDIGYLPKRAKAINVLGKVIRDDNEIWVRNELKRMNCKINIEFIGKYNG